MQGSVLPEKTAEEHVLFLSANQESVRFETVVEETKQDAVLEKVLEFFTKHRDLSISEGIPP